MLFHKHRPPTTYNDLPPGDHITSFAWLPFSRRMRTSLNTPGHCQTPHLLTNTPPDIIIAYCCIYSRGRPTLVIISLLHRRSSVHVEHPRPTFIWLYHTHDYWNENWLSVIISVVSCITLLSLSIVCYRTFGVTIQQPNQLVLNEGLYECCVVRNRRW